MKTNYELCGENGHRLIYISQVMEEAKGLLLSQGISFDFYEVDKDGDYDPMIVICSNNDFFISIFYQDCSLYMQFSNSDFSDVRMIFFDSTEELGDWVKLYFDEEVNNYNISDVYEELEINKFAYVV